LRKADPINDGEFQDKRRDQNNKKQKKGFKRSKEPIGRKPTWQRALISEEVYDQDVILKKIKALDKKSSITKKKSELPTHMNHQVHKIIDEKNYFERDSAFIWTLCQLERNLIVNKVTRKTETDTLTLYLKRTPRPEVNVMVVYDNLEKAKFRRSLPAPQQQPPNGPQQRASSQGPQGPPKQGGRVGPAPVKVIQDPHRNGGKPGGNGGPDDIVHVIDTGGPRRKPGADYYKDKRKNVHHSDDSKSSRSSETRSSNSSGSDSDSAYSSDSETDPSSTSLSSSRRRRDSGYARGRVRGSRQHEKDYIMFERPRRHPSAAYVPDPPRPRGLSYERLSNDPIEVEHRISEAKVEGFAAGCAATVRASVDDRTSMPPQRGIMYSDDLSQPSSLRSVDEEIRALDETRAEVLRLEILRAQEEQGLREALRHQAELRLREKANPWLRDLRREDLRSRTDIRRGRDIIRQDEVPSLRTREPEYLRTWSLSPLSSESMPSPRQRDFEHLRRRPLSPLPLDQDVPFMYVRNPFAPRRRNSHYN
jgi:hypothetical protein